MSEVCRLGALSSQGHVRGLPALAEQAIKAELGLVLAITAVTRRLSANPFLTATRAQLVSLHSVIWACFAPEKAQGDSLRAGPPGRT